MEYSRFWRKNRSAHETAELALALRALRKVGGHIGINMRPICWSGMSDDSRHSIVLDPDICKGRFPIPFRTFDCLAGEVVLKGLSSIEWTEWVRQKVLREIKISCSATLPYLEEILSAAEDIHIHSMTGAHIWSGYIRQYFTTRLEKPDRDPRLPPSPVSLADWWRRKYFSLPLPPHYHHYYDDPKPCFSRFEEKIQSIFIIESPEERRKRRVVDLVQFLRECDGLISEWEIFQNTPDGMNFFQDEIGKKQHSRSNRSDYDRNKDEQPKEKLQPKNQRLSPETAEDIKKLLEEDNLDISRMVALAVNDPEATDMKTCLQKGVALSGCFPDKDQVRRLKKIFKNQEMLIRKAQRKRLRRGLSEGKLDPGCLYRVPLDGRVFRNRDAAGNEFRWQICIVVDASSSMGDKSLIYKSWNMAEKALASIAEAFKGSRNLLRIYAYNENRNVCRLTRLNHSGQLFTVMPKGRTPSGQAILSAALVLSRKYRNSMILHITDGASNCGLKLAEAISFCRKKGIRLYTIGCGCNPQTRDFLIGCFLPANVFFLRDIQFLSFGIEKLLRQKMLNS